VAIELISGVAQQGGAVAVLFSKVTFALALLALTA
jgi:hypothetical protein